MTNPLHRRIEALLFTQNEPLSVQTMATVLNADEHDVVTAVKELEYIYRVSAMELKAVHGGWRLQLKVAYFDDAAALSATRPVRYSRAFWETLAYIAYHQPVTRADIDAVRGVTTSSGVYRQLFDVQWVKVIGQREVPGRPDLLATTDQFLRDFSLRSPQSLPEIVVPDTNDSIL